MVADPDGLLDGVDDALQRLAGVVHARSTPSRTRTNSSPPSRATVSDGRTRALHAARDLGEQAVAGVVAERSR